MTSSGRRRTSKEAFLDAVYPGSFVVIVLILPGLRGGEGGGLFVHQSQKIPTHLVSGYNFCVFFLTDWAQALQEEELCISKNRVLLACRF